MDSVRFLKCLVAGCGDHTRAVEETWRSQRRATEEPWRSRRGAAEPLPLSTILRGTQSRLAGHEWSSPCDCPLRAKCGRALQLLFFKVTSGSQVSKPCLDHLVSPRSHRHHIYIYFFNSAANLLCIIRSKMTRVKLHFHFPIWQYFERLWQ